MVNWSSEHQLSASQSSIVCIKVFITTDYWLLQSDFTDFIRSVLVKLCMKLYSTTWM